MEKMDFQLPPVGNRTLHDKAMAAYAYMHNRSELDNDGNRIWEGYTSHIFKFYDIGSNEYSKIMNKLRDCRAITVIRKGSGKSGSAILLRKPPDKIEFNTTPRQGAENTTVLWQKLNDLEGRLSYLQDLVESQAYAINALTNHEYPSLVDEIPQLPFIPNLADSENDGPDEDVFVR